MNPIILPGDSVADHVNVLEDFLLKVTCANIPTIDLFLLEQLLGENLPKHEIIISLDDGSA